MSNTIQVKTISLNDPLYPSRIVPRDNAEFLLYMATFVSDTGLSFEASTVYNADTGYDKYGENPDNSLGRIFLSDALNGPHIKINVTYSGYGYATMLKSYAYRTPVEEQTYPYALPAAVELNHQKTANNSTSASFHYAVLGSVVLISVADGSGVYHDVMFDKERKTLSYFTPSAPNTLTTINNIGSLVATTLKTYNDHASVVSLAPLVVPSLGIACDNIFVPFYMKAQEPSQQFICNDNVYFTSGCVWKYYNSSSSSNNYPHFIVRAPQSSSET